MPILRATLCRGLRGKKLTSLVKGWWDLTRANHDMMEQGPQQGDSEDQTAIPVDTLITAARERPWARGVQLRHAQIPNTQKLGDNTYLFLTTKFGSDLLCRIK